MREFPVRIRDVVQFCRLTTPSQRWHLGQVKAQKLKAAFGEAAFQTIRRVSVSNAVDQFPGRSINRQHAFQSH
jgi:hypothetical protein